MTACVLASLSVVLLVAGPLGTRLGLWTFIVGFAGLAAALSCSVAAIALAVLSGSRTHRWSLPVAAALIAAIPVGFVAMTLLAARGKPPIHDITTDTDDAPPFVALVPLRSGTVSPAAYDGPSVAAQQRRAYPEIRPLEIAAPPARVFDEALALGRERGWAVIAVDRDSGRIEAVDTTFWFGFKDDVVIRVRPLGGRTRVDMRSKSRVGVGDLGVNARRVAVFLSDLRDRVSR
jgi:uncharacterized protein (DUF1499 family)